MLVWHGHLQGQRATLVAEVVVNLFHGNEVGDIKFQNLFGIQSDRWTDRN